MSASDRVSSRPPIHSGAGEKSQCSTCHGPVDPLRAARVRIIDDRFHYFCSAGCAATYDPRPVHAEPHGRPSAPSQPIAATEEQASSNELERLVQDEPLQTFESGALQTPVSPTLGVREQTPVSPTAATRAKSEPRRSTLHTPVALANTATTSASKLQSVEKARLLMTSMATAGLSLLLLLAIEGELTSWVRTSLLDISLAAALTYFVKSRHDENMHFGTVASLGIATVALTVVHVGLLTAPATVAGWLGLAGTQLGYISFVLFILDRKLSLLNEARSQIARAFGGSVLRLIGAETVRIPVTELRPGEEIVVHAGEVLPVDAAIIAGSAEVHPWLGTDRVREIGPDDFLYAGTRLTSGQLRAVVRWNGNDRHWMRLTHDPNRMAHVHAPSVASARKWGTHVAPVVVALAGLVTWLQEPGLGSAAQYALATAGVLLSPAGLRLIQAEVMGVVLSSLRHGIVIATASVIDAASKVSAAVFCARGTLLLGEPELSFLHPMGSIDSQALLAFAAGAEQVSSHPIANSVLRAARAQNVVPDAVRNPRAEPGLGVTALSSDGRVLIVGSRALMLRERISVARAEHQITELEATGRTVLLVALDGHLAGILAFQDGLRAGARASIQHLLDAGIEPILLSGDARETCEALAKTIDVEHVRPDVLPPERGKEIERLRGGGGVVAVVGRSPTDDLALSAASVGIALPGRGSQAGGFDIELASDEVQNAALALNFLSRHRKRVQRVQTIVFGGGILTVFATIALAIPAGFLPVGALLLFAASNALTTTAKTSSTAVG
jgi:P-type Cu+ transporter